jgi:hypothetical protein
MIVRLKVFIEFQTTTFMEQASDYPYMTIRTRYDDSYSTEKKPFPTTKIYFERLYH